MSIFHNLYDMGDNVTFIFGDQCIAAKVCGVAAHRLQDDSYDVTYQVRCQDGKILEVNEKEILK